MLIGFHGASSYHLTQLNHANHSPIPSIDDDLYSKYTIATGHVVKCCTLLSSAGRSLLATGSYDGSIKIWNLRTGECLRALSSDQGCVYDCVLSRDGQSLVAVSLNTCIIWNVVTGLCLHVLPADSHCCSLSSNGSFVATGTCNNNTTHTIKIWSIDDGRLVHTLRGHTGTVSSCEFSYDDSLLASASWDMTVKIWDARCGTLFLTLQGHVSCVNDCAFSPQTNTLLATASSDRTVKIWNVYAGVCLRTLSAAASFYRCVFSPNGLYIATLNMASVDMWRVSTGTRVRHQPNAKSVILGDVAFDGLRIIRTCDYNVHVWELKLPVNVLLMILIGNRNSRLWIPPELWQFILTEYGQSGPPFHLL